eukprot:3237375-Lingulodinium_polyedra.AAC.1
MAAAPPLLRPNTDPEERSKDARLARLEPFAGGAWLGSPEQSLARVAIRAHKRRGHRGAEAVACGNIERPSS